MKLAVLATVCAAAAALLVPAVSSASPYIQYGVQDDAYLSAGPSLDSRLGTLDWMTSGEQRIVSFGVDLDA